MNLYKKNLEFLKKNSLSLYNTVLNEIPVFKVKIELNDSDLTNYYISRNDVNCFINSIYSKERELLYTFNSVPKDVENIILFGFGSELYANYISENFKNLNNVIIVEPSLQIFKQTLKDIDLYNLASKLKTSTFIINKNAEDTAAIIVEMLKRNLNKKVAIIYNISYKSLFQEYFAEVEEYISQFIRTYMVNTLTKENFKQLWIVNTFKNLKRNEPFFINDINDIFKNKIAIMVSGGPSLEKNIQELRNAKNKAVIFAVGSAIKILDSNGIVPHFRVAVDGNNGQVRIFNNIDKKVCALIHGCSSFFEIPEMYESNLYRIVLKSDFLSKYIYDNSNIKYKEVDIGNSVANCTLDLICKLGFKKVIFTGQDLCYSDEKLYAKGSWRDEKIEDFEKQKQNLIEEKNIYGEKVYTTIPFLNMRDSLEVKIFEYKDIEYINSTEGGLNIYGTKVMPLKAALDSIKEDQLNIEEILKSINYTYNHEEYIKSIEEGVSILEKELNILIDLNNSTIEFLKDINFSDIQEYKVKQILKRIEDNEENLYKNKLFNKVVIPYIGDLLKAIEDGIKIKGTLNIENFEEKAKVVLNKSMELREYLDLISLLIEEFEGKRKLNIKYD